MKNERASERAREREIVSVCARVCGGGEGGRGGGSSSNARLFFEEGRRRNP